MLQPARQHTAGQRTEGVGGKADDVRPRENPRAIGRLDDLSQARLLHRQKRPDLIPAWADYADHRRHQQQPKIPTRGHARPAQHHQKRAPLQHAPAPQAVGASRHGQRNHRVAEQRQRQQNADPHFGKTERAQVQHEYNGEKPVREKPDRARRKQQKNVAGGGGGRRHDGGTPPMEPSRGPGASARQNC